MTAKRARRFLLALPTDYARRDPLSSATSDNAPKIRTTALREATVDKRGPIVVLTKTRVPNPMQPLTFDQKRRAHALYEFLRPGTARIFKTLDEMLHWADNHSLPWFDSDTETLAAVTDCVRRVLAEDASP